MIKIGKEWVNYTYNQSKVKLMENSITANNDEIIARTRRTRSRPASRARRACP